MIKSILIVNELDPNSDPRPNRLIKYLLTKNDKYKIAIASEAKHDSINEFYNIPREKRIRVVKILYLLLLKLRLYNKYFWSKSKIKVMDELRKNDFDIIICHDLVLLPLVFAIKKNAKVFFDAREYYSRHFEDRPKWNFFYKNYNIYLINEYMSKCERIVTPSPGAVNGYKEEFDIDTELLMSLPEWSNPIYRSSNNDKIKFVHHGLATPSRHIEIMINVFGALDNSYTLDLYLVQQDNRYYDFLVQEADRYSNVNIQEPVKYEKINDMLVKYDVGFFLVPPSTFNLLHTLPNKLFEFIQAGIAVCIGPSPDMASIVNKYKCGMVAETFNVQDVVNLIKNTDTDMINQLKKNTIAAAAKLNVNESNKIIERILSEI